MPTGYTAKIRDGISFKEFALDCARAFGACIELRDEGGGGEKIPDEFGVSDYHYKRLAEAGNRVLELTQMTRKELAQAAQDEYLAEQTRRQENSRKIRDMREKYENMLEEVISWIPPTTEHHGLKDFMISQIKQSIDFDCRDFYKDKPLELKTPEEWLEDEMKQAQTDSEYHATEWMKERERVEKNNQWIRDLRKSLCEL